LLNKKFVASSRLAFHKKFSLVYNGTDFSGPFTQTVEYKFIEYEASLKFALTPDGLDKPTSVFLSLATAVLFGKQKETDTRYGTTDDDDPTKGVFAAGLTLFQRLGDRFILYAEPAYRLVVEGPFKTYLGEDNYDKPVKLNHYTVHVGILFLIGKSNR
jgi:hypothetical protein